jgi:hypothetical protein
LGSDLAYAGQFFQFFDRRDVKVDRFGGWLFLSKDPGDYEEQCECGSQGSKCEIPTSNGHLFLSRLAIVRPNQISNAPLIKHTREVTLPDLYPANAFVTERKTMPAKTMAMPKEAEDLDLPAGLYAIALRIIHFQFAEQRGLRLKLRAVANNYNLSVG